MSTDKEFVVKLLLEKAAEVEDRYDGYREKFRVLLEEVVQAEREYYLSKTPIIPKITNIIECEAQDLKSKSEGNHE